jgi:hypothetical protein
MRCSDVRIPRAIHTSTNLDSPFSPVFPFVNYSLQSGYNTSHQQHTIYSAAMQQPLISSLHQPLPMPTAHQFYCATSIAKITLSITVTPTIRHSKFSHRHPPKIRSETPLHRHHNPHNRMVNIQVLISTAVLDLLFTQPF